MTSYSTNLGLIEPTPADPAVANVWGTLLNTNQALIDAAVAGVLSLDVSGSSNVVLTNTNGSADQERNMIFSFTGTLTGNIVVLLPETKTKFCVVQNATSGAFTLSVGANNGSGSAAGTTVTVPQGTTLPVWSDGTNVAAVVTAFVSPTFSGTVTMPDGSTWTSTGIANLIRLRVVGNNTTTDPVDFTNNVNGISSVANTNSNTGNAAYSAYTCFNNASSQTIVRMLGSGYSTSGINIADSSHFVGSGAGGVTVGSLASAPLRLAVGGAEVARVGSDGSLLVGSTTNAGAGAIAAVGNITAYYSDDRLKTRLGNIENALEKVCALSAFYYEPNETAMTLGYLKERHVGLSAQEVKEIMPEVIAPAPIDRQYMTIRYNELVPLLVEAIKDLRAEVADIRESMCCK